MTIRVLLADDQPLLRRGFALLLGGEADLSVVGEAADGVEAVRLAAELRPDVTLMDIRMPHLDGIGATRQIIAADPAARVILLTTFDLDEYAFDGLGAGASGFLLKDAHPAEVAAAGRTVASGDAVIAPSTTRRLLRSLVQAGRSPVPDQGDVLHELTSREREVFAELVAGLSNAEIADRLSLAEATVKSHVGRILAKLGLRDRVQAVVFAYRSGIVGSGEAL